MAIENISHHITRILIIDDDPVSTKLITKLLAQENLLTKACDDPREAWSNFESFKPHVILLDINMPHLSGQELLDIFHSKAPDVPVLMITGDQQEALAKVCLNAGAFDFIEKPIVPLRLICSIRKSLEVSQTEHQLNEIRERLQHNPSRHPSFSKLLTNDSGMEQLFHLAEVAAKSPRDILITGETGTGKDLLAQAIHQISGRTGEFVALNVGGLDDEHFSDTLFGHVKGSFTGAIKDRKGLVEKAAGGTLFLDEKEICR
jgi:DNA-binding NtrC family response regulator